MNNLLCEQCGQPHNKSIKAGQAQGRFCKKCSYLRKIEFERARRRKLAKLKPKTKNCRDCKKLFLKLNPWSLLCEDCKLESLKRRKLKIRVRLKNQSSIPVKEFISTGNCTTCGIEFTLTNRYQKKCEKCRNIVEIGKNFMKLKVKPEEELIIEKVYCKECGIHTRGQAVCKKCSTESSRFNPKI